MSKILLQQNRPIATLPQEFMSAMPMRQTWELVRVQSLAASLGGHILTPRQTHLVPGIRQSGCHNRRETKPFDKAPDRERRIEFENVLAARFASSMAPSRTNAAARNKWQTLKLGLS